MDELTSTCPDCGDVRINQELFTCFTESPTYVMYRARIEGTSQTNSSFLISLIESWVRSGDVTINVTQIRLTVDPECSVSIPSLTVDWECEPTTTNENHSNIIAIIGGLLAFVTALIIIATTIIVIVILKHQYKNKARSVPDYVLMM